MLFYDKLKQKTLKNQETLTNEQIKQYIDQLVSFYGHCDPIKETALSILFQQNLYGECLRQIMIYMRLKTRIKITYLPTHAYQDDKSLGYVTIPETLPFIGTPAFKEMLFVICAKAEAKQNFHTFVYMLSHEVSHIVLHGSNHPLKQSEMATDLCTLVFGFEEFVSKGRCTIASNPVLGSQSLVTTGYLSHEQVLFATSYLRTLRKKASNKKRNEAIFSWFKKLLRITPRKSA